MSPNQDRKKPLPGLQKTLEGILERLRDGVNALGEAFQPKRPQAVPIPVPTRRTRK